MTVQPKTYKEWVRLNNSFGSLVDFLIAAGVLPVIEPKSIEQVAIEVLLGRLIPPGFKIVKDDSK